jgi:hypothetical protein
LFEALPAPTCVPLPSEDEEYVSLTAQEVKDALRRRHPGDSNGSMVGQWTCIEEYRNIDLLALNAWRGADVIGYEVKVSRSDMRGELLKPGKRAAAVVMTTEFYFAVPAGMLRLDEIAWDEPEWLDGDFKRMGCPGVPEFGGLPHARARQQRWGGECRRAYGTRGHSVPVPGPPEVIPAAPSWFRQREGEDDATFAERWIVSQHQDADLWHRASCWTCGGKGYLERSRVEREAPQLWVPRDVGLVEIGMRGCRVMRPSPVRKDPKPLASTRHQINDLVRWVSHRPDPRHR